MAELPGRKLPAPAYDTCKVSEPAGRLVVDRLATPPESVAVPRLADPFQKVTTPVGVPERVAVTVVVIVTEWLSTDGLGVATSDAVVGEWIEKEIVFAASIFAAASTLQYLTEWLPRVETLNADPPYVTVDPPSSW